MHVGEEIPRVGLESRMRDALLEMTAKRLGVTAVVDDQGRLVGVVTDGDLRRALGGGDDVMARTVAEVMARTSEDDRGGRARRARGHDHGTTCDHGRSSSSMPTSD